MVKINRVGGGKGGRSTPTSSISPPAAPVRYFTKALSPGLNITRDLFVEGKMTFSTVEPPQFPTPTQNFKFPTAAIQLIMELNFSQVIKKQVLFLLRGISHNYLRVRKRK